jgi:hypothetical protein
MPETTTTGTTQKPLKDKKKFKGGKQATQKGRPNKGGKDKRTEKAPVVVAEKFFTPAFLYISECCDVPAKKEPLVWSAKDKEDKKFSENHKGHFRCTKCGKPSKVRRIKNTEGVQIVL